MINPQFTHARYFIDHNNVRHLLEHHPHDLKYAPTWGWLIWDGKRWQRDHSNLITSFARETLLNSPNTLPPATYGDILPRIKAMLTLAPTEPDLVAQPSQFDTHPFLLNVANGTLDLRTGALKPHDPRDFITRLIPIEYQSGVTSPIWDTFLAQITSIDPSLQHYLQRAIGYTLTGSTREETFFILFGPGRNGKSCFLSAISSVLGDYVQQVPSNAFTRNAPLTPLASLTASRFVTMTETASGQALDLNTIKRITSGEPLPISTLKGAPPLQPQFKLWLATNNLPAISEYNAATWQRIKLLPFATSFIGHEDRELSEKLATVLPAILAWAVQGALLWYQGDLQEPDCIKQATRAYRNEQDELADFFLACCLSEANQSVKARDLYTIYQLWSKLQSEPTLSETNFGRKVLAHGYQRERNKSGNVYRGLGLIAGIASTLQELARQNNATHQSTPPTLPSEQMHY